MNHLAIPTPLARGAMRLLPAPLLAKAIAALMMKMEHRHPRLFLNLARLDASVVHVEPSDIPHKFALVFGGGAAASLRVIDEGKRGAKKPNACIKGDLDSLLSLLEGKIDGDTMFFSREITISGDTSVIVALRNTLDREEIRLMDDAFSLLGPFAEPAGKLAAIMDGAAKRVRRRLTEFHATLHKGGENGGRDLAAECDNLREELHALQTRLAKSELRNRRKEAEAT